MPDPTTPSAQGPPRLNRPRGRGARTALLVGGIAAVFVMEWSLQDRIGPFWLAAAGAALLWPIRRSRAAQAVLWAGGFVFGAYVVGRLGGVLTPFVAVFVAAYVLRPVVEWARGHGVPEWASSLAVTASVVGVAVVAAVLLVPVLLGQVEDLATAAVGLALQAPDWVARSEVLGRVEAAGFIDRDVLVGEIATLIPAQVDALIDLIPTFVAGLVQQVGAVLGLVTTAALVPVLLFFCLKDYDELVGGLIRLLPRYEGRRAYIERADQVFGSYVRGVLAISAISGVLVALPLTLLGAPFSLVLGIAAALLNLIPSLGSILTYVLGVGLMLAFGTWADVATVLVVLAVQAVIEQAVLTPNIMSQQVGLHPVVILLALFVSGALFGLVGFVLAVPVAALAAGVVRARREALVIDLGEAEPAPAA